MVSLHVLLSFLLFSTCTAKPGPSKRPAGASPSDLGFVYWFPLSCWGAKGPGSKVARAVIPLDNVPPGLVGNHDDLVFFAEVGPYLPLEDKYKEEAKSYFPPGSKLLHGFEKEKVTDLGEGWINTRWARIAKWEYMRGTRQKREGKDVRVLAGGVEKIVKNMRENLDKRIKAGFKLNYNAINLGQTFEPFIPFGSIFWLSTLYLGYEGTGAEILHPIVALGRLEDSRYRDHDLILVAAVSTYIPGLSNENKGEALKYFDPNDPDAKAFFTKDGKSRQLNIGYAQVVESITFCFRRLGYWGAREINPKNLQMKQVVVKELLDKMQKDWDRRKPELNFNLKNLGQPNPKFDVHFGSVYRIIGFRKQDSRVLMVAPIGPVPNRVADDSDDVFVAELSPPFDTLSEKYWEPATKDCFPVDIDIRASSGEFKLWSRKINAKWAVVAPASMLFPSLQEDWVSVKMEEKKRKDILDSMLANHRERAKNGETNFIKGPPAKGKEPGRKALQKENPTIPAAKGKEKALQTGGKNRCMYCGSREHPFSLCQGSDQCQKLKKGKDGIWRDETGKAYCAAFNGPRGCPRSTCRYEHACSLCPSEDHGAQSCSSSTG